MSKPDVKGTTYQASVDDVLANVVQQGSLQVPTYSMRHLGGTEGWEFSDGDFSGFPENWFVELKGNRMAVGREHGYLYLTKAGWKGLKDEIKKRVGEIRFLEIEKQAKEHFAAVDKANKKFLADLEAKVKKVKAFKG